MDSGAAILAERGAPPADRAEAIRSVLAAQIAPLVERIDREGHYPETGLRALGEVGAFSAHLSLYAPGKPSLAAAIADMEAIGAVCMSTAFCTWCQDACGWYLEHTPNEDLRDRLQPGVAAGRILGGTGLSNPVKALAGIEELKLRGKRVAGGWIVNGVLPWVSNLGDGHWFGTVFEDAEHPTHRVMAMFECGPDGADIRQNAHFIALEGTNTFGVRIRRVFVPDANILSDPFEDVVGRIRPGFVLLQTGMGFGVIAGAVKQMRCDDVAYGSTNRFLPKGADAFEDAASALRERVATLADNPGRGPDYMRAVLEARLAVSELTLEATQASVLHAGARGYLEGSAVFRRQREGNFVAIITPSIRHLRQEILALSSS